MRQIRAKPLVTLVNWLFSPISGWHSHDDIDGPGNPDDPLLAYRAISSAAKAKLELLAKAAGRSKSFLAAEAIGRFIEEEAQIIEGVRAGLADAQAGRVTSHEDAMKTIHATIDRVESDRV